MLHRHTMSHTLLLAFILGQAPQTTAEILAGNSYFPEFVGMFFDAIFLGIAVRYKLSEWKTIGGCAAGIVGAFICRAMLSSNNISISIVMIKAIPSIAILSWVFLALLYKYKVNNLIDKQSNEITSQRMEIDNLSARVHLLLNPYKPEIVSLPANSQIGTRIQSGVTICQILQKLDIASSVEQKRAIANSYMGIFVMWECKLFRWSSEDGQSVVSLTTGHDQHFASVFVSISDSEAAHIKGLPMNTEIMADGRIYELCTLSKYVKIDNARLTIKSNVA